jgi:hypothetical protein
MNDDDWWPDIDSMVDSLRETGEKGQLFHEIEIIIDYAILKPILTMPRKLQLTRLFVDCWVEEEETFEPGTFRTIVYEALEILLEIQCECKKRALFLQFLDQLQNDLYESEAESQSEETNFTSSEYPFLENQDQ